MNFEFKKSLGQNFIKDENIINKIVNSSLVDKNTLVIEIGPGSGSLSKKIIPLSGFTILYEIDTRLENILNKELNKYDNYKIIFGDVLEQDVLSEIKNYNYDKIYVVANLPYYITTPIIIKLMNEVNPDRIVIMIQEEVAVRLSAVSGSRDYGMISALLGSKYDIKRLFKVGRNNFQPVPNVDSMVISMDRHNKYLIKDFSLFERFIKDAFKFKRKNLKNNLMGYDLNKIESILVKNNYSLTSRAEDIPVSLFIEITNNL